MKKIIMLIIFTCLQGTAHALPTNVEGYECAFTVTPLPFTFHGKVYETTGHILTSVETHGVHQANVLGFPFAGGRVDFPTANVYTYKLSGGQKKLLLQISNSKNEVLKAEIFNAGMNMPFIRVDLRPEVSVDASLICQYFKM